MLHRTWTKKTTRRYDDGGFRPSLPNFKDRPPLPKSSTPTLGPDGTEPTSIFSSCDSQENVRNPSPKKSEATRKPQNQNSPPHHLAAPFRAPSWEFSPLDQKNHGESIEALRSAHLLQLYEIQAMPGAFQGYLNIRQRMECT